MTYEIKIVRADGLEFTAFTWAHGDANQGVERAVRWAKGKGIPYRSVYALPCYSKPQTVPLWNRGARSER